ncbi:hypothetical protein GCM10011506_31150 [Marivirga lumbricoides]|uniref:Porin n=1 Tax=Marivirga lumbricoides TaxID=1046115 RepID=A0ABQ1MRK5_9BACT|nr:hypothetical protein GCM10011506_31150 [Marivirga lumbricoides]
MQNIINTQTTASENKASRTPGMLSLQLFKLCIIAVIGCNIIISNATAQEIENDKPLKFSGYLEAYYVYDFGNPANHNRPDFLYSFSRHNEVNLNFGYLMAEYDNDKVRGKLALMTGTYANANLSAEPGVIKNIFEANAGVKISKNKNLWIDAGIFASHIGFESAVGADTWNMTRSILAENSPYFLSGAKISYTSEDEKWFLSGLLLNGWQRIQRVDGNQTPAFGHQVTYSPNEKVTLNSSSFIGSDTPDSIRQMRYFHNLYGIFQLSEKLGLIAGFDIGIQQDAPESSTYNTWYAPVMIAKYDLSNNLSLAGRLEFYSDENGVIIPGNTPNGFQTLGYSLNLDYAVTENALWRIEARSFNSEDLIFMNEGTPTDTNFFLGTSMSVRF